MNYASGVLTHVSASSPLGACAAMTSTELSKRLRLKRPSATQIVQTNKRQERRREAIERHVASFGEKLSPEITRGGLSGESFYYEVERLGGELTNPLVRASTAQYVDAISKVFWLKIKSEALPREGQRDLMAMLVSNLEKSVGRGLDGRVEIKLDLTSALLRLCMGYQKTGADRQRRSRDVAALNYLSAEGIRPDQVCKRFSEKGEGLEAWSKRWRASQNHLVKSTPKKVTKKMDKSEIDSYKASSPALETRSVVAAIENVDFRVPVKILESIQHGNSVAWVYYDHTKRELTMRTLSHISTSRCGGVESTQALESAAEFVRRTVGLDPSLRLPPPAGKSGGCKRAKFRLRSDAVLTPLKSRRG